MSVRKKMEKQSSNPRM